MFTYWLVDEDTKVRKSRLRNSLRQPAVQKNSAGSTAHPTPGSPSELRRSRHSAHTGGHPPHDRGSVKDESPHNRTRRSSTQLDPDPNHERNLFDFLRDSDSGKPYKGSFKRRRSFEGRPMNKDFVNVNGNLCRNNSDSAAYQSRGSGRRATEAGVPSIVVDSPMELSQDTYKCEPPTEYDCLLEKRTEEENEVCDQVASEPYSNIPLKIVANESTEPFLGQTTLEQSVV